jgi:pimeloyl-ACP methyl ester carboxylesterase
MFWVMASLRIVRPPFRSDCRSTPSRRITDVIKVTARDGVDVRCVDEGQGFPILVVHGGMNSPSDWDKVAGCMVSRFRIVRLHRRQYRLDVELESPITMTQETDDVVALATAIGEPVLLVGHSSGAVLGLEAMVAAPSLFAGAVLYEPPLVTGPPLGGEALRAARTAFAAGKPGKALGIFLHRIVQMPWWTEPLSRIVGLIPKFRPLISRQLDDCDAIDRLGVRLEAYSGIDVPVVLLRGDRSPTHLSERTDVLAAALPRVERVVALAGQGHGANDRAPRDVAKVIEDLAGDVRM